MMKLIAIGENVCDIYLPEGTMHPGGQCANTAVYARMLGMESAYLGQFGTDLPGAIMKDALGSYGVDLSHARMIDGENGYCRIEHRNHDRIFAGSNLFGVMRTHPMKLTEDDWNLIREADLIYTDINSQMLSYLPDFSETGIPVAFDFSAKIADEDLIRIAPYVTIASLSFAELSEEERVRKMKLMEEHGTKAVLGTVGEEGSMLLYQGKIYREPAAEAPKIVDTLGAGDAYFTALISDLFKPEKSGLCSCREWDENDIQSAMKKAAVFAAQVIGWEGAYPYERKEGYSMTKLLLFDLDGTLLRSDKTISERTLRALQACRAKGTLVGVVTSRAEQNSMEFLEALRPDVLISSAGALVKKGDEVIFCAEFSAEEVLDVIDYARKVAGNLGITVDTMTEHFGNIDPVVYDPKWKGSSMTDFSAWDQPGLKICLELFDEKQAKRIAARFPDADMIRFSDGFWYKLTKKEATKENAIRKMGEACGIELSEITAFGDDYADIGMLKLCGKGVAMGNAIREVKEVADEVIGSNDADGIAIYLEE